MKPYARPKGTLGPILVLLFILFDLGLLILAWHLYQKKNEGYDGSGFAVAASPDKNETLSADPAIMPEEPASRMDYIVAEKRVPSDARDSAPSLKRIGDDPDKTRPPPDRKVSRAVRFYYDLKNDPRFKDSPILRDWRNDFLSYSDLRAVNKEYQEDRDAVKFMVHMTASPNFKEMLKKHFERPESKEFVKAMTESSAVKDAVDSFTEGTNMKAMLHNLGLAEEARKNPEPPTPPTEAIPTKARLEIKSSIMDIQR